MEEAVFYNLSQDETLGGDSPSIHKIPSQAALKAYIDSKAGSGGPNYFYVEDASGAANTLTIKKSNNALPDKVFEWSIDKQNWTEITVTDTTGVSIAVPANGRVYLRGDNETLTAATGSYYLNIVAAGNHNVGGNLTTLIQKSGNQKYAAAYYLASLFKQNNKIISAADLILPADYMAGNCYYNMFNSCAALTTPPALPAKNLMQNCYSGMFSGCSSLTVAPILPAETPVSGSYANMFYNCALIDRIVVYATSWTTQNFFTFGVAATGDFYNLGGATIPTGTNGIPSGWTEHTQLP